MTTRREFIRNTFAFLAAGTGVLTFVVIVASAFIRHAQAGLSGSGGYCPGAQHFECGTLPGQVGARPGLEGAHLSYQHFLRLAEIL